MFKNLKLKELSWDKGRNAEYPYQVYLGQKKYQIRVNDFSIEPFYSLIEDEVVIEEFDDWPQNWNKPS